MVEFLRVRWRQTKILLRKNWILIKRNKRGTILQLCVPFIFVAFLFILQYGLSANTRLSKFTSNVETSEVKEITKIPRCTIGTNSDRTSCTTLAFVTNAPEARIVMDYIRIENDIPEDEIREYGSSAELDEYLDANPNSTLAAYLFNVTYSVCADNSTTCTPGIKSWRYTIQVNNSRLSDELNRPIDLRYYLTNPMNLHAQRAIARYETGIRDLVVNVKYAGFPHPEVFTVDVIGPNGPSFFFGALMFNFVIQLGQIVTEKELLLRDYMNLMGLSDSVFWFTWWVTNTTLNILSCCILIISGLIFQFDFFLKNDFPVYFVLFILFGISMVPMTFAVSTLLKQSRTATSLGFVIFLAGSLLQSFAGLAFSESFDEGWRVFFSLFPFAVFSKGVSDLAGASDNDRDVGLSWSEIDDNAWFSMNDCYAWLAIDFGVFWVLTLYLDNVISRGQGVSKPLWFFLLPSYWFGARKSKKSHRTVNVTAQNDEQVDEDVQKERTAVLSGTLPDTTAVAVVNLVKTYTSKTCGVCNKHSFTAVAGSCFHIEQGQLFCLLGHNGAGKTTTINMLIGMFPPTSGDAIIFGNSILDGMDEIRKIMGVCPQHDILWEQLTGREHLEMFAAFKNLQGDEITNEVKDRLADVELTEAADLVAAAYSGGMKRRLSTAIALTADPKIVYLDEPTTGMDPVARRQVWNLIEKVKRGRIIVLTTHSMEEADVLGDRIAIMKKGQLECIGSSLRLKNKFGAGYKVTTVVEPKHKTGVEEYFQGELGLKPIGTGENFVEFNVSRDLVPKLPKFFKKLEKNKKKLNLLDIQLGMTTLEEVFLAVAGLYEFDE